MVSREWRQFKLLARDSVRRLLNAAVLSRDADPWQFAIWATALVQTPPTLFAISQAAKYAALRHAPAAMLEQVELADRLFFVFYAMVAAALLASVTWEALFPDRIDQEVVGALPVRPRTLAAARLSAAVLMAIAFSTAISLPSAVLFSFFALTHPGFWHVFGVMAGHLLGVIGGAVSVFLALLVVRGVAAILLTSTTANLLAAVLQLASVSGLIEAFLYAPSILPPMLHAMLAGDADAMRLPPVWFTAVYTVLGGTTRPVIRAEAARAGLVFVTVLPLAAGIYLLPSAWMARRVLESSSKHSTRWVAAVTRLIAALLGWTPRIRALVMFAVASFTRSRRHVLVVVTQFAIGLAIAAIGVIAATVRHTASLHQPAYYMLSIPLVLMFFSALGLRSAFVIPTELDANWAFRIVAADVDHAAAGTRRAMMALVVLPLSCAGSAAALVLGWPPGTAADIALLDIIAGVLLVECVTYGWHAVPFAREHVLSVQALRWRGFIMVVPLVLFAYAGARIQMAALHSPRAAAWYVAMTSSLALIVHRFSVRESRRHALAFDDDGGESLAVLNLSNATS